MPSPVRFELEIVGSHVEPGTFVDTVRDLERALAEVEQQITGEKPRAHWRVENKPVLKIAAEPNGLSERTLREIVREVRTGLAFLQGGPEERTWESAMGPRARKAILSIGAVLPRVQALRVQTDDGPPLMLTARRTVPVATLLPTLGEPFSQEVTSIDGVLDLISVRGKPHFSIQEHGTQRRVRADFDDAMFQRVKDALGNRVVVQGTVRYRRDGTPKTIRDVSSVHVRRKPKAELASLMGAIPDFTGGVDAGEYVRRLREGDDQ